MLASWFRTERRCTPAHPKPQNGDAVMVRNVSGVAGTAGARRVQPLPRVTQHPLALSFRCAARRRTLGDPSSLYFAMMNAFTELSMGPLVRWGELDITIVRPRRPAA